jgi:hypothetical protein
LTYNGVEVELAIDVTAVEVKTGDVLDEDIETTPPIGVQLDIVMGYVSPALASGAKTNCAIAFPNDPAMDTEPSPFGPLTMNSSACLTAQSPICFASVFQKLSAGAPWSTTNLPLWLAATFIGIGGSQSALTMMTGVAPSGKS